MKKKKEFVTCIIAVSTLFTYCFYSKCVFMHLFIHAAKKLNSRVTVDIIKKLLYQHQNWQCDSFCIFYADL